MNFAGLFFLVIAHFISGRGVLQLFKLQLSLVQTICFSFIIGVPLLSFVPCIVQLLKIPITFNSIYIAIAIFSLICGIPAVIGFKRPRLGKIVIPQIYEWPFLLICLTFIVLSAWRCFYYPTLARDMLSGPELLAEYAVREKTMISSVFSIDLHTTNNYFKSPYITCLQIIYKLLVQPFGQTWMTVLYIPFVTFMFTMLHERIHAFFASLLLFLFMAVPDLFAYSFVMLYDYSNMVFFFCGFYFLIKHLENKQSNYFLFAAFLFGLATYIRVETLVLVGFFAALPLYVYIRERVPVIKIAGRIALLLAVPFAAYIICMQVFVHSFVPITYHATNDINPHLGDISYFFNRIKQMNDVLIFGAQGLEVYGYFFNFFLVLFFADIIFALANRGKQTYNKEARYALFGIVVIYFGLPFLGYLFPLYDIMNTTKRGLFKIIPIMILYMANSGLLQALSKKISDWDSGVNKPPQVAKPRPVANVATAKPRQPNNPGKQK